MKTQILVEENLPKKVEQIKLPYSHSAFGRKMSKRTIDLHYDVLHHNYVKKFNDIKTHDEWNYAGAVLHNMWWEQLSPKESTPGTKFKELVGPLNQFKNNFVEQAISIHGNGWCYLSKSGKIKTIPNHEYKTDIVLLLDLWEHAYIFDYGSDKDSYIESFWSIINWDVIEDRLS